MDNETGIAKRIAASIKKLFTQNIGLKIAAVLFAMVIWGIVLTTENQARLKVIQNVPVKPEYEYELHNKKLAVRGQPFADSAITARVNVPITGYLDFTNDNIAASVDLRNVNTTGEFDLDINVTFPYNPTGYTLESLTPGQLHIEVDELITKSVPVEAEIQGSVRYGFYADISNMRLSAEYLEVSGPRQDVQPVTKVLCHVNLDDRANTYNGAVDVVYVDQDGNELDGSSFLGGVSTVTVYVPVSARKTVPINVSASLLGEDNLAANYELYEMIATPETLDIIGSSDVLAAIDYLTVQGIDISGRRESVQDTRALILPEGVRVLNSNISLDAIDIFLDIREKTTSRVFEAVPIETRALARGLTATLSSETVDVNIQGRITLADRLDRSDIEAYVDLSGLPAGTHTIPVSIFLGDDDTTLELIIIQNIASVTVVIE